jgi:phage-related protein
LVVLANGFQKKTQKTPKKEIEKALKIKDEYEKERQ